MNTRQRQLRSISLVAAALVVVGFNLLNNFAQGSLRAALRHIPGWSHAGSQVTVIDSQLFDSIGRSRQRVGAADAPVTLVVFGAYACGACGTFSRTLDSLKLLYPQEIAVVSRSFVPAMDGASTTWHQSAACAADQGRFEQYDRLLYRHLQMAADHNGWLDLADSAGIPDRALFYGCVRSGRHRRQLYDDTQLGLRLGVHATPTFFANGVEVVGTRTVEELSRFVRGALGGHDSAGKSTSSLGHGSSASRFTPVDR
jgi:hypothetical protein